MHETRTRRAFLQLAAGAPLVLAAGGAAASEPRRIATLIQESRTLPTIGDRVGFISRGLIGRRYRSNTLIGGPDMAERFVVRDDVFDCVTFCEVVLSAARARTMTEFETTLRRVRYAHDRVDWDDRNHYFAEWCRLAVSKGLCAPVDVSSEPIRKTVNWFPQGRREVGIAAIPRAALQAERSKVRTGDIIGFVSRRANLDFYHTGFVAFGASGQWLLRHASQRRGRVIDEPMDEFLAANSVRHVALLRPLAAPAAPTHA